MDQAAKLRKIIVDANNVEDVHEDITLASEKIQNSGNISTTTVR